MKPKTLLGQNITNLLEKQGKTLHALATFCGVSDASASGWKTGATVNIEGRHLLKAAEYFAVSPYELLNELVDTDRPQSVRDSDAPPYMSGIRIRAIPVVGLLQRTQDGLRLATNNPDDGGRGMALFPTSSMQAYAVGVAGDELRPRFKPGESLIIDPTRPVEPGHEVYVTTADERVYVVVLDWHRGGMVQFSSVNESERPFTLAKDQIASMHRIVGAAHHDMHVY